MPDGANLLDYRSPAFRSNRPRNSSELDYEGSGVRRLNREGSANAAPPKPPHADMRRRPPTASVTDNKADDYGFLSGVNDALRKKTCWSDKSFISCKELDEPAPGASHFYRGRSRAATSPSHWTYNSVLRTWDSTSGLRVYLDGETPIVQLSASECRALRKICLHRLQLLGVGCRTSSSGAERILKADHGAHVSAAPGRLIQWIKKSCNSISHGGIFQRKDQGRRGEPLSSYSFTQLGSAKSMDVPQPLESGTNSHRQDLLPHSPAVPVEVRSYIAYLETHCLRTVGLFRIGSTQRRIRELEARFTSPHCLSRCTVEDYSAHDIASLLKGFFRKLPDALLCCRLYQAFLSTREFEDTETRITALRCLLAVLPSQNRDLLYALLKLLASVSSHSDDGVDEDGNQVSGNKMDSRNLASMFGPCILHDGGVGAADLSTVDSAKEVIEVVKEMIDNWSLIYSVTKELHDEVFEYLTRSDAEGARVLLDRRAVRSRTRGFSTIVAANRRDGGNYVELIQAAPSAFMTALNIRGSSSAEDTDSSSASEAFESVYWSGRRLSSSEKEPRVDEAGLDLHRRTVGSRAIEFAHSRLNLFSQNSTDDLQCQRLTCAVGLSSETTRNGTMRLKNDSNSLNIGEKTLVSEVIYI